VVPAGGADVVVADVVVVGALLVGVVVGVTLVVVGGEVKVGPAEAGKPTPVLPRVRCPGFGDFGAARWRRSDAGFGV
jgi:hypothetical protein